MPTTTTSVEVERPADQVFAYATDPSRFSEWQQGVVDGSMESSGEPTVGARFRTLRRVGPMKRPFTSEIEHLDAPRSWGVRGIDGPIRAAVEVEVTPLSERRSRLTISITFDGRGIGRLVVPLAIEPGVPKEMERDLATLKERMEAGTDQP
jgi:carbon monoxide dehydrogenase subunit G